MRSYPEDEESETAKGVGKDVEFYCKHNGFGILSMKAEMGVSITLILAWGSCFHDGPQRR